MNENIITGSTCVGGVVARESGAPPGRTGTTTLGSVFTPASRQVGYYIISHHQVTPNGPDPSDTQRFTRTGSGINGPPNARFVDPSCP